MRRLLVIALLPWPEPRRRGTRRRLDVHAAASTCTGRTASPATARIGAGPLATDGKQRRARRSRGVGALAADFYLRTGYMPLRDAGEQPRRSRVLFTDARDPRARRLRRLARDGPAGPDAAPGARQRLARACSSSPSTAPAATRSSAQGGYVTGARRAAARRRDATRRSPRRSGSART